MGVRTRTGQQGQDHGVSRCADKVEPHMCVRAHDEDVTFENASVNTEHRERARRSTFVCGLWWCTAQHSTSARTQVNVCVWFVVVHSTGQHISAHAGQRLFVVCGGAQHRTSARTHLLLSRFNAITAFCRSAIHGLPCDGRCGRAGGRVRGREGESSRGVSQAGK
jgi:hypothetical protein